MKNFKITYKYTYLAGDKSDPFYQKVFNTEQVDFTRALNAEEAKQIIIEFEHFLGGCEIEITGCEEL